MYDNRKTKAFIDHSIDSISYIDIITKSISHKLSHFLSQRSFNELIP